MCAKLSSLEVKKERRRERVEEVVLDFLGVEGWWEWGMGLRRLEVCLEWGGCFTEREVCLPMGRVYEGRNAGRSYRKEKVVSAGFSTVGVLRGGFRINLSS